MEIAKRRNGIRHPGYLKVSARELRQKGMTHREIARRLRISLGSASLWTKGIELTSDQKKAVFRRAAVHAFPPERREKLRQLAKSRLVISATKHTKEGLLRDIVEFYGRHGRIPMKREFNMYRAYKLRFGSWNNAIRLAGFNPNPVLFAYKFKSRDGHACDSFTEKIIDDWLSDHNIHHLRNIPYGQTKMTCDFFLPPKTVVEFFGLAGVQEKYDKHVHWKREFCKMSGLELVELYPKDLFPKNNLSKLLNKSK